MSSCSSAAIRRFGTDAKAKFLKSVENAPVHRPHPRLANLPSTMSVLVPLCVEDGSKRVILTKRSAALRTHRREICFPGGKKDEGETLEQTALRETDEEIGLAGSSIDIWGRLRPVVTRHLTSTVTPVVGMLGDPTALRRLVVNQDEVQVVYSASLDDLGRSVRYTQFKNSKLKYKIPVFCTDKFKVLFTSPSAVVCSELRVWGLSAVMLHQVLEHVAPEYSPALKVAFY